MNRFVIGFVAALAPAMVSAGEPVDYTVGGETFQGYRASAEGPSKGLVMVVHDWDGLTDYEVERADMLAALGYDAFAVDLYGKGNRPVETGAKKAESGRLYNDRERMRALLLAGLAAARSGSDGPTVVMGYCFGGAAVLEMARSGEARDIAGYATFHGGLATPQGESYPAGTPPILIAHGGADSAVSMTDLVDAWTHLESAGVPYEIQIYAGAPHAFTVFGAGSYREIADHESWDAFTKFLRANL